MGIAGAILERNLAQADARSLEEERRLRDRQIVELEEFLEAVEAQNLQAAPNVPAQMTAQVAELARRLVVPAPPAVLSARSGARLHDALPQWQGALLDALRPHRLRYADRFD